MGGTTALDLVQGITECAQCGFWGLLRLKTIFSEKPGRCIFGVCSPARPKLQPQTKKHSRGLSIFWLVWSFRALDFGYLDFGMILFLGFGRYWRYSSRIALKMLFTQFGEAGKLEKSVLTDPVDYYFRCHTEISPSDRLNSIWFCTRWVWGFVRGVSF